MKKPLCTNRHAYIGISWAFTKSVTEAVVLDYKLTLHATVTVHDNLQLLSYR